MYRIGGMAIQPCSTCYLLRIWKRMEGRRRCTGSGEWRFNMLPVKDMETNGREEKMYRIGGMAIQHATCEGYGNKWKAGEDVQDRGNGDSTCYLLRIWKRMEGRRRCTGSGEWRFNMLPVKDMETNGRQEKMYRIGGGGGGGDSTCYL